MAYDYAPIEREWATGVYSSVRALAAALKVDARFEGNAPSHVGIQDRMHRDIKVWEEENAAGTATPRPKPWQKNLARAIREETERRLAVDGFEGMEDAEAVHAAAAKHVDLTRSHMTYLKELREDAWDLRSAMRKRLDLLNRSDIPSEATMQSLVAIQSTLAKTVRELIAAEREVFGIEANAAGTATPLADAIRGISETRDEVEQVLDFFRSVGPGAAAGSSGAGAAPA